MKKIITSCLLLLFSLTTYSQDAELLNARGFRQAKKENYLKAIIFFTKAIQADPYFEDAYYNRALAYSKLKRFELSIADYTRAISIRPRFRIAYNNRGADRN